MPGRAVLGQGGAWKEECTVARPLSVLVLVLALALGAPVLSQAKPTAPVGGAVGLTLVASGLTAPVTLVEPPDGSGRLFVVDQVGVIWIVQPDGTRSDTPFLDLRDRSIQVSPGYDERGALGLAFHPDYATNGRFFVYYSRPLRSTAPADWDHTNVLSEFHVSANNPDLADLSSERVLLQVDWPYLNHNGGTIAFGPDDGDLYLSMGDGGNADDVGMGHVADWYAPNEGGNGQDTTHNLLGSILRLDIDNTDGAPYGIPADNPMVNGTSLAETYAYGFRNPYRFSFDQGGDHDLYVGDAGQELWEEVSRVTAGGNYGWNVKEGTHCFDTAHPSAPEITDCPSTEPDGTPLLDPIIEVANSFQPGGLGATIIGGNVYRGAALPALAGKYVFGMWSSSGFSSDALGRLLVATPQDQDMWSVRELLVTGTGTSQPPGLVLGFGQDLHGEMYVMITNSLGPAGTTGKVYRLSAPDYTELPGTVTLSATLSGANQAPLQGDPDGFGFARVYVNPNFGGVCYRVSVANIGEPMAAHIHVGGPGMAGDVVVPLMPVDPSGLWSGCVAVDPALAAAIVANPGGYYVNVHTIGFPAGAIRGQLELLQ